MAHWIAFTHNSQKKIGILDNEIVEVYSGDMFNQPLSSGEKLSINNAPAVISPRLMKQTNKTSTNGYINERMK